MKKTDIILKKIESTSEWKLREIMGNNYIDTPGFCNTKEELKNYSGIQDCMLSNMGESEFNKLKNWIKKNPKKIKLLFKKNKK